MVVNFETNLKKNFISRYWGWCAIVPLTLFLLGAGHGRTGTSGRGSFADTTRWPATFGFGRKATASEITRLDIDVMPDGAGLPAGMGKVSRGRKVYELKCASCHGKNGSEGPFVRLVGVIGDTGRAKTIGNYWPYSTTIFDYIRRAMPYNKPGSLADDEVYALTAFLLYKNRIIDSTFVVSAVTLPKISMPARKLFVDDDRRGGPEVR